MKNVSKNLLKIGAVSLKPNDPFTWASGIKSPIYTDNRSILSYPEARTEVIEAMAQLINEKFAGADRIMGTATAGIPHAALVADKIVKPMGYVRSSAKKHGRQNQIEGVLNKGDKVVLIEDLISTGGSCLEAVEALRNAGAEVLGVVAIFTYGLKKADANFVKYNCRLETLTNVQELLEVATEEKYIEAADRKIVTDFFKSLDN